MKHLYSHKYSLFKSIFLLYFSQNKEKLQNVIDDEKEETPPANNETVNVPI